MFVRAWIAAVLLGGCYDPPTPVCGFLCGPESACPFGYACNADGYCHVTGTNVSCPLTDAGTDAFDFSPVAFELFPMDQEFGVPLDVIPRVRFTEVVTNVSSMTITLTRQDPIKSITGVVSFNPTTRTAFFDPDIPLDPSRVYLLFVSAEIVDLSGKPLVDPKQATFSTAADLVPPSVTMVEPADGSTNVATDAIVIATFSEEVSLVTTTSFLLDSPGGPVACTIGFVSETAVSLIPSGHFLPNTVFAASLTSAITDFGGNPLENAPVTWTFTTGADTIAPTVVARSPVIDDTDVPLGATVDVKFSEQVLGVSDTSMTLEQAGIPVLASVAYFPASRVASLTPNVPLAPNTVYTAKLSSTIADGSANPLAPLTWSFTTVP